MKIVHICIASYYADGFGYQENLLTKYNKMQGHDVTIITSVRNCNKNTGKIVYEEGKVYTNEYGIKVIRMPYSFRFLSNNLKRMVGKIDGLYDNLKKENPDLVFTHNVNFLDMLTIKRYMKSSTRKVVWFTDNHGDYINTGKNWISLRIQHGFVWKNIVKACDKYISKYYGVLPVRCEFLRDIYKAPQEKIDLLYMGADDEEIENSRDRTRNTFLSDYNLPVESFIIATGGKIDVEKKIHNLIDAINLIDGRPIYLLIFGVIRDDFMEAYIREKVGKRIRYIGWQDQKSIYTIMLNANLCVFPGTHSVMWEQACACGTPCIFKRWRGMDHVKINNNCILMDEVGPYMLCRLITELYDDKARYLEMKKDANSTARYRFLYKNISQKVVNDYIMVRDKVDENKNKKI